MSRTDKILVNIQALVAYVNFIWFAPFMILLMKVLGGYRFENLPELREKVARLRRKAGGRPIILAANHLTVIDSLIINWALYPMPHYLRSFVDFPWNVPELSNFARNPLLRIMCYLGKCIYIARSGSRAHKRLVMAKLNYLSSKGHSICIFPEGGRSRTGFVDPEALTYGIGELVQASNKPVVWCLYMRGQGQESYSWLPAKGENFYLDLAAIELNPDLNGRRGARQISQKVIAKLGQMEERYFDYRQRSRLSQRPIPSSQVLSANHN